MLLILQDRLGLGDVLYADLWRNLALESLRRTRRTMLVGCPMVHLACGTHVLLLDFGED